MRLIACSGESPEHVFGCLKIQILKNYFRTFSPGKKVLLKFFRHAFPGALLLTTQLVSAQGDLLLYPKRIIFDGTKRSQTLNLANTGKDTVRYLISIVETRMKEDGSFETITVPDSGQRFADPFLRFFPRNVVLGPNEAQAVKIQVVNSGALEQGEYRSHIYFRAQPAEKPLGENGEPPAVSAISVSLTAIFGITIPVIIRAGESTAHVTLTDPVLEWKNDSVPSLHVNFNRTGNMSVYGDLTVDYISVENKVTSLGAAKGLALYTPNTLRHFNVELDKNPGLHVHQGKLRIVYRTQADANSAELAETILNL